MGKTALKTLIKQIRVGCVKCGHRMEKKGDTWVCTNCDYKFKGRDTTKGNDYIVDEV